MKIICWNVNGIRSVLNKGFVDFVKKEKPDVLCLQEVKASEDQLKKQLDDLGYDYKYWAEVIKRKGYSGVVTFCKKKPISHKIGIDDPTIDDEGRVVITEFKDFILLNCYFPYSARDHSRVPYKMKFNKALKEYVDKLVKKGKNVVVCGDYNVAHTEIDLKNPKTNKNNPGFLQVERDWMTEFLNSGYIDTFRHFHPGEEGHYTFWTHMFNARARNVGWRVDYFCVNKDFIKNVKKADILPEVMGSDHCPIRLVL